MLKALAALHSRYQIARLFSTAAGKTPPAINTAIKNLSLEGTTIVRTKEMAQKVIEILYQQKNKVCAWDTETIGIDAKEESPVGKGSVICASAFCGPEVDFGHGPRLFIDNYADAQGVINEFKKYFEDPQTFKCWHNYGFDRHILYNHGIDAKGFAGDTMHLARLYDPARVPHDYSLASLSEIYFKEIATTKEKMFAYLRSKYKDNPLKLESIIKYEQTSKKQTKIDLRHTFGFYKTLKNGAQGKTLLFPDIEEMHTNPKYVPKWIEYSVFDAEITYFLRESLAYALCQMGIKSENMKNMYDLYCKYWLPFGELLTDMERVGIRIDLEHLKKKQAEAENDRNTNERKFLDWVHSILPNAKEFNASSPAQMQQLLFAPFYKVKKSDKKKKVTTEEEFLSNGSGEEEEAKETAKKRGKQMTQDYYPAVRTFRVENLSGELKAGRSKPLKYRDMEVKGLGIPPVDYTDSGLPKADMPVMKALAGDPAKGKYGLAYQFFKAQGKEQMGIDICVALSNWLEYKRIDTLLQTFIIPLQTLADKNSRIHCSMNMNTETGRISARKPNLMNQPAYEKDKYQIRKAFIAEPGCKFVVADYGQLELRVLAHMTNCKSMIEAFKAGGDFHSRTAIGMFPEIQKEVDDGKVLLEWDYSKGKPDKPLIKDKFGSERRKAKGINFSIAYGKTAHGFAKDWNCSVEEAEKVVSKWFQDRPEVREWQERVKKIALEEGWTQTLLGRYRNLSQHFMKGSKTKSHGLRAAINTPIQGGAADLVIAGMVKLSKDKKLKDMGWKLLLQIHDEVIMEGPKETAEEVKKHIKSIMEHPLANELRIPLEVDAKISDNWYEGK